MAAIVAILGALTALLCAVLLLRGWRNGRQALLLWASLCFFGLAWSNSLLVVDLLHVTRDLYLPRLAITASAMALLIYGLVWETDKP
jgi:hypothetical protein